MAAVAPLLPQSKREEVVFLVFFRRIRWHGSIKYGNRRERLRGRYLNKVFIRTRAGIFISLPVLRLQETSHHT